MYAVIQHGSHQYRVTTGDRLLVDRLKAEVGATVKLEDVLLLGGDDAATSDGGELAKAVVTATVVAHRRGRKLRVMTYKPKKRHRRTLGYRSQLTELLIEDVQSDGSRPSKARAAAPEKGKGTSKPEAAAKDKQSEPEGAPAAKAAKPAKPAEPKAAAKRTGRTSAAGKASKGRTSDGA